MTPDDLAHLIAGLHGLADDHPDLATMRAIFEQAERFSRDVLEPAGKLADAQGARIEDGRVKLPPGQRVSWAGYIEGGWAEISAPEEFGGQGLPLTVAAGAQMLFDASDVALGMLALNQRCAIRLLRNVASPEQQALWIPRLVSCEWAATICISEPDAGSDVGRIRTRAVPGPEGSWRLTGQKCWISYGDHDLSPNVLHLILARTPDAAPGTRGLTLFLLPDTRADGTRNGIEVMRIEEKMGLHASPTCVLAFEDAEAEALCPEGRGMASMFEMIVGMRLGVGGQGSALANRAAEVAWTYAASRAQGGRPDSPPVLIHQHADVRRLLLEARLSAVGATLLTLQAAAWAQAGDWGDTQAAARAAVMLPVVKTFAAEAAFDAANHAMQVLGAAGYTREWPVERIMRDSRVFSIFEGTTAIQALDLTLRQLLGAGAQAAQDVLACLGTAPEVRARLASVLEQVRQTPRQAQEQAALPLLRLFGLACVDGLLRRAATTKAGAALLTWHEAGLSAKLEALAAATAWTDTAALYAAIA
ncbi:acyl-CoA dehydrogenase family protein [Acidocella sp.]|uniref:acyl-CoA dehydrogenase family protein n=1 Tax=Acidocella sp. TaxID=50710 RepID=UPI002632C274|nr:acyl-CoA dehydrogenase family protein [Acidocella sp.]